MPTEFKPGAEMEDVDAVLWPSSMRLPVTAWSPLGRLIELRLLSGVIIKSPLMVVQSLMALRSSTLLTKMYPPEAPHPPVDVLGVASTGFVAMAVSGGGIVGLTVTGPAFEHRELYSWLIDPAIEGSKDSAQSMQATRISKMLIVARVGYGEGVTLS